MANEGKKMISAAEVARMLGVHPSTLTRYRADHRFPAGVVMPSGRLRFDRDEILGYIEAQKNLRTSAIEYDGEVFVPAPLVAEELGVPKQTLNALQRFGILRRTMTHAGATYYARSCIERAKESRDARAA